MKNLLLICFIILSCACKKEDNKPVKIEVYGSARKYKLGYFINGEMFQRSKIVDSAYSETYFYKTDYKYGFNAAILDSFGYVVIRVSDANNLYSDSIVGTFGVAARVNP